MDAYDIIVVGAGHAGSEAAAAAANLGSKVLIVTMDMTKIAQMSCNPAMGGIAKGQIVREIDALGGYSGLVTDHSMIQFRMLNRSKGPAMWSPRAQCDRMKFSENWRHRLESIGRLDFWQDTVTEILIKNGKTTGIRTKMDVDIKARAVILTSGTFMNGLMHVGKNQVRGGRASEPPSTGLSDQLAKQGFVKDRMKTGTPARIDGRTVDFSKLTEQRGDEGGGHFSYLNVGAQLEDQLSCYIAHTHNNVHDILREGIQFSPLYNGTIQGVGPRYCPSIEDKIVTFAEKSSHQLFLEPEGRNNIEYYLNGFSSSLPLEVQLNALRQIEGFGECKIFRPGYAIEYDYFDPTQLHHSMETKHIENLYFAGQVNGTTGYEEAAAQGLIAGINAHRKNNREENFILKRDEAYLGVLIDDLVTKGVDEPYRMFTSRAEYRILLRQDDADQRLTEKSFRIGLASEERMRLCEDKYRKRDRVREDIKKLSVNPGQINKRLEELGTTPLRQSVKLNDVLKRPQVSISEMKGYLNELDKITEDLGEIQNEVLESVEILIKYEGYIEREKQLAEKVQRLEHIKIPESLNYDNFKSISTEARQKLKKIRPETLGQASRISGVSPADISVLLVHLRN